MPVLPGAEPTAAGDGRGGVAAGRGDRSTAETLDNGAPVLFDGRVQSTGGVGAS